MQQGLTLVCGRKNNLKKIKNLYYHNYKGTRDFFHFDNIVSFKS